MSYKQQRGNTRKNKINSNLYNDDKYDEILVENIKLSIQDYINKDKDKDTVSIGEKFSEWCLLNLFELREDEVQNAIEISGKYDNGIDAVFDINDEMYIIQCKYNSSHSIDSMSRFKDDCAAILTEKPLTDRDIVKEKCALIRDAYNKKEIIHCYYITNSQFEDLDKNHLKKLMKPIESIKSNNVRFYYQDIIKMTDKLEEIKGLLPKKFRNIKYNLTPQNSCEMDNNTVVASISLKEFGRFVKKGDKMLYISNIRNYLKKTKINTKIEETIEKEPEKFWYYNNGITIVCKDYSLSGAVYTLVEPQIVNGCQTAKSIMKYYSSKTSDELKELTDRGKILVKIIRINKKNRTEDETKILKDNITRYTNSQNSVRGLDFYALDVFQKDLKKMFEEFGYYYEIQRGAYITLNRNEKSKFKGCTKYNYLLPKKHKNVLPAKEVMQSFTAGLKEMPHIAYGHTSELTPIGNKWNEICNEETKKLPVEHFLYPYLLLEYIKNNLGYKSGSKSFRKSSALLFVSTYYKFIVKLLEEIHNKEYEDPLKIKTDYYIKLFDNRKINEKLIYIVDEILEDFMYDGKIEDFINDSLKDFLKSGVSKKVPQEILDKKLSRAITKLKDKDELGEIKELLM